MKRWKVPTIAQKLAAVRHSRRLMSEGVGSSKAKKLAAKEAGYSPASLWAWEKQFPARGKHTNHATSPKPGSRIRANNATTTRTPKIRIDSVNFTTKDGHTITLTRDEVAAMGRAFE